MSDENSKKPKNWMKYVAIVAVIIIIVASLLAISFEKKTEKNELSVDAMYLLREGDGGEVINVSAIIYLTNVGGESGSIKIIAYLMERWKGVAVDRKEMDIGKIDADKTKEIVLPMEMGNKSYEIEVLVFEDDLLKIKGGGAIRTVYYHVEDRGYIDVSLEDVYFENVHQ